MRVSKDRLADRIGLYSIPHYAVAGIGLSQTQGAAIQSILSAGQLTGRPLCGLLLDRIGRINGAAIVTVRRGRHWAELTIRSVRACPAWFVSL